MQITTRATGFVLAIAATLALAGCAQSPPPAIPTAEPSFAPVFKSDAEALAAAKKAYVAYLAVSDEILIDGGKDPSRLLTVATNGELNAQTPGFAEFMSKGWHSTGGTQIDQIRLQGYFPTLRKGIVIVYACIDVTNVRVLNREAESVVSSSRPSQQPFQATFDLAPPGSKHLILAAETPWNGSGICS
jgi:hypothetical protein